MIKKHYGRLAILLFVTLFLFACQSTSTAPTPTSALSPTATICINENVQPKVKRIFAIGTRSYAVLEDGSFWQWGGSNEENAIYHPQKLNLPSEVTKIIGGEALFALLKDGTLWSWGKNYTEGWLGDGTTIDRSKPLQILEDIKDIYIFKTSLSPDEKRVLGKQGYYYITDAYTIFALKNDGTLWGWGRNDEGQLSDGTFTNRLNPVKIMDHVKEIASSEYAVFMLKDDGTLWGRKSMVNETSGPTNTWEKKLDGVEKAIPQYQRNIAYITEQGELYQYIRNIDGKVYKKKVLDQVIDIQCYKREQYIALKDDGTLWITTADSDCDKISDPMMIKSDIQKILFSNGKKLCVLSEDNTAYFTNIYDDALKPIAYDVSQLASSQYGHYLMISAKDSKLYGWGSCSYGQLGVDLNQGEVEILLPVEISFPIDWETMN